MSTINSYSNVTPADGDKFLTTDVSDSNNTKNVLVSALKTFLHTTATFTGDFLVDVTTFFVDSTNNRVGIGSITPSRTLEVTSTQETSATFISTSATKNGIGLMDANTTSDTYVQVRVVGDAMALAAGNAEVIRFLSTGHVSSGTDNTQTFGTASQRWSEFFAGNATINTSDSREKTILSDDDKVLDAIDSLSVKAYKWNDAIESKGDNARIHYGVIAQEIKTAFEEQGLSAEDYGVLCYDEWEDKFEEIDGEQVKVLDAGNRYGVRYSELYALKIACLERKIANLGA